MKEKIKKIWKCIKSIAYAIWLCLLLIMVIFSIWASYNKVQTDNKHARNDREMDIRETRESMEIGHLLTWKILGKYHIQSQAKFDSVYRIESEKIINNIYKKK